MYASISVPDLFSKPPVVKVIKKIPCSLREKAARKFADAIEEVIMSINLESGS